MPLDTSEDGERHAVERRVYGSTQGADSVGVPVEQRYMIRKISVDVRGGEVPLLQL